MKKPLIIISVLIIFLVLSAKTYFNYSLPGYTGLTEQVFIQDTVEVFTDNYGVPHIFAENERDLFFMAGYVTARERLFQMTVAAAAGRGELSLLLGDGMLSSDIYLRNWGIPEMSRVISQNSDQETIAILEAFCQGVNAWIDESENNLPPEFKILGARPFKWSPKDVYGYGRLMARELQQSWKPEMLYGSVLEYFGPVKTAELLPPDDPSRPTIASGTRSISNDIMKDILAAEKRIRTLTGTDAPNIGSNNWVISGNKTETGKPVLANDPHLKFTQPAKWFEMHLKGGRFDVSGVFLPGVPIPVIGQNASSAWGYTNIMADDMDFFIETIKEGQYLHGGEWKDIVYREETIPLKNGRDTVIVIASTHHGPIIMNGVHPLIKEEQKAVSVSWAGNYYSDEMSALLSLSLMKDWNGFTQAVKKFSVPGQNMVYADTAGNIGWRPAVRLPVRKEGNSLVPRPGTDPDYDWKGFVPFNEMPFLYNPPEGYIATANNKTIDNSYPHYISNLWCDHARIERIRELLEDDKEFSIEDIKRIQNDVMSPYAREIMPVILDALDREILSGLEQEAYEILKNWDYRATTVSPGALIFNVTMNRFIHLTYKDELDLLSDKHFEAFVDITDLPYRNILAAVKTDDFSWFDDVKTKDYSEKAGDIIARSFREAIDIIRNKSGKHTNNWKWGTVHQITHPHDMGKIAILDLLFNFNVGPFESPGSPNTINDGGFRIDEPFNHVAGPSMRRIVDLSNIHATKMVLPSGNSGLPKSKHYSDQAALYNLGVYKTTNTDENTIRSDGSMRRQVFVPLK